MCSEEFLAPVSADSASLAQLAEHALRKRMVVGSIPTGGLVTARETETDPGLNYCCWQPMLVAWTQLVYFAPRKRMLQVSTPTGAALCSNRAGGAR